jgi:hypothetical protein
MADAPSATRLSCALLAVSSFLLVAIFSSAPLLLVSRPLAFIGPRLGVDPITRKALVAFLLALPIGVRTWLDGRAEKRGFLVGPTLVLASGRLTAVHLGMVDDQHADVRTVEGGRYSLHRFYYV